jgi:hypothetical protein
MSEKQQYVSLDEHEAVISAVGWFRFFIGVFVGFGIALILTAFF